MKHILLLGAGRSTTILLDHLLACCGQEGWTLTVGDLSQPAAAARTVGYDFAQGIQFDIHDAHQLETEVGKADLVISMLPARFHLHVAQACLQAGKHLLTASYVPTEMRTMHEEVQARGLLFLMECGLDPGIDHMSAMRVIDHIRSEGHSLTSFETFAGGLLHPDSHQDNPWGYKFTWNPRNVVIAGQGGVKFIQEGRYKYIPYHRLFRRTEVVYLPGYGHFEGYANRDSLKYLDVYGLQDIQTLYRGTFRRVGYCQAWDIFVQLGATDDSYELEGVDAMTHRQFINSFLSYDPHNSVELKLAHYLKLDLDGQAMYRLKWLGMFEEEPVGLEKGTPAQVLEHILKKKWSMTPEDRDQIVMWHKFDFLDGDRHRQIQSHLVVDGDDATHTAMAKTVGLPLGIAAELLLKGELAATGVQIPILPSLYQPILAGLAQHGMAFVEREMDLTTSMA